MAIMVVPLLLSYIALISVTPISLAIVEYYDRRRERRFREEQIHKNIELHNI